MMAKLDEVKDHYEKFPYPPSSFLTPFTQRIREDDLYLLNYASGYSACYQQPAPKKDPRILVVGCGTLEPLAVAKANPLARILALDISEQSLNRLAYNLRFSSLRNRVELKRADICELTEGDGPFDYIIATGVVHHLENPLEGLKKIRALSAKDGVIRLMVYSRWGRDLLYRTKELATLMKVSNSDALRTMIDRLPPSHPYKAYFYLYSDTESNSGLMDGYLHPCDKPVDALLLRQMLDAANISLRQLLHRPSGHPKNTATHDEFWFELAKLECTNQLEENFSFFAAPAESGSRHRWPGSWKWNPMVAGRGKIYSKILDREIRFEIGSKPEYSEDLARALLILPEEL